MPGVAHQVQASCSKKQFSVRGVVWVGIEKASSKTEMI